MVPQSKRRAFDHGDLWHLDCNALLSEISAVLFEPRCLRDGKRGDFLRWIPCERGGFCVDETPKSGVIDGAQFTLRLEEPYFPQFWRLFFVACQLDANCTWTRTKRQATLVYDIYLTNGHPTAASNGLLKHFSFEEQVGAFTICNFDAATPLAECSRDVAWLALAVLVACACSMACKDA